MLKSWREKQKRRHDFERFRLERFAQIGEAELDLQKRALERGLEVIHVIGTPELIRLLEAGVELGRFRFEKIERLPGHPEVWTLQVEAMPGSKEQVEQLEDGGS
jgi:hypothetical protein